MLSFSDLTEHPSIKQINVTDIEEILTFENLSSHLSNAMEQAGYVIEIKNNEIKSGNILKSQKHPCIVVYNTNHRFDYYQYCITLHRQGSTVMVNTYLTGSSKLEGDMFLAETRAQSGGLLGKLVNKLSMPDEFKIQEEQLYYTTLNDSILQIFRG